MIENITKRNENAPFYFEILYAGIEFLSLIDKNRKLTKIEIKPDRKHGANRRIEDLTKFYTNGSIEVVQIKHSVDAGSKFGFGDLWKADPRKKGKGRKRKEGTNVFKFLKSWRSHRTNTNSIRLTLASNRIPTDDLKIFLSEIAELRSGHFNWADFQLKYSSQIASIKRNCNDAPFKNDTEFREFITSFYFEKLPNLNTLEDSLGSKLKSQGVASEDRVYSYITRTTKAFISEDIEVLPQRVFELISRLKTGLIQEISAPAYYIERKGLEKQILKAIEKKKAQGGFVTVYAPSGSGKTVFLSQLSQKNADFFPYLCRIRPFEALQGKTGYANTERLNSKWFKVDIIQRCFEFGLLESDVGLEDDENFVDKVFEEALNILSKKAQKTRSKKIVIIIDALDQVETDKFKGKSILDAIPTKIYPGIVFLLSTWGPNYLPQSIKSLPKSDAGIELYFTEREISEYFWKAGILLTKDQVSIIKNKTNGLAISLLYLSNRFKNKRNIDSVISSITKYTEVFDWYKPIWDILKNREKNCLGFLCYHLAPVKRENLREMVSGLNIAAFNSLLIQIQPFVNISKSNIEPYHDSFRRFVVSKLRAESKAYNQRIAKYYSKHINLSYTQRYITKHLQEVGLKNPSTRTTFEKLHRDNFFVKILQSTIDDRTKVGIGRTFVDYFYHVNNIKELVKYSIVTSDIYPTTYDSNIYEKAKIGTDKFLAQIDEELMMTGENHSRDQREWVFKRLSIGNILLQKKNKNPQKLAQRLIDDSLFRLRLNPDLLWKEDKHLQDRFWNHVAILTQAMVNAQRYDNALSLVRSIHFQKPTARLIGFKGTYLANVHIANYRLNPKKTTDTLLKSSKVERLLTYLEMEKRRVPITTNRDYFTLLNSQSLEKYLYDDKADLSQRLDLAEALFIHKAKNFKSRIIKLIHGLKIEIPHADHGYIYWGYPGNTREFFLRFIALHSLLNSEFDLDHFYTESLKEKYPKSSEEKQNRNKDFSNILSMELELAKNRLLLRAKDIRWNRFFEVFTDSLKIFQNKVEQIDSLSDNDYSDTLKTLLPYKEDIGNVIRDNIAVSNILFPNKSLLVLEKIESIVKLKKQVQVIETLIEATPAKRLVRDKVEAYLHDALAIRQREKLDSTSKSDNLISLSTLATQHGFDMLAEKIFEKSLRYSRGVWNKGDLRFTNLIDSLRTQDKKEFDIILRYLYKITDIVEKTWYWKHDFLESATVADFEMSLDYLYSLVIKNEVNVNDGIGKIISAYIKSYAYAGIRNILPLVELIDMKGETGYDFYKNITSTHFIIISWAMKNNDSKVAQELAVRYLNLVMLEVEPPERINLLNDFIAFLLPFPEFKKVIRLTKVRVNRLLQEGYSAASRSSNDYGVAYEQELESLKAMVRKKRIGKLFQHLTQKVKTDHYTAGRLVAKLLPYFDYKDLLLVEKWASQHKVHFEKCDWLAALMKSASFANIPSVIKEARSKIISFMKSQREYEKYRIIRRLEKVEFPNKKRLMRTLLLMCIRELAGSGYYLPQFFMYTSDSIDSYFIELKQFSFGTWKSVFEHSMRLSLSK